MDRGRLEAFSDGVFAVAITLLALNLAVKGPAHPPLSQQLWDHRWAFGAYLLSFFAIGIVWVNHHTLIKSISVVDRTLLFLNLVLLLFVVLIPFATATVADYMSQGNSWDARVAMMLYAGVLLGMSIGFGAIFEWTLRGEHRLQPLPPEAHWPARLRFVGGAGVYVVAIVVALFNAVASFILIGLVAVYYIAQRTPSSPVDPSGPGDAGESEVA